AAQEPRGGLRAEAGEARLDLHPGDELAKTLRRRLCLGPARVRLAKEDLPGEVGALDAVVVHQHQPDLGRLLGKGQRRGAAESPGAEDDRGFHAARTRLNSRSPVEVTSASPPSPTERAAAAAA